MRILVTGSHSYIGTSFCTYAAEKHPDWQIDAISLQDGAWKSMDFSQYDAILHAAGIAHADRGAISPEKQALYYQVNTQLTVEVAQKAKADGVGQFLYLSSAILYGDSAPIGQEKCVTAQTQPAPASCYGDSKLQAENGLRKLEDESFKVALLRLPMVYGPGSKGNYPLLAKAVTKLPMFPNVRNQRSMLYIENLCEFLCLLIQNRDTGTFWPQNASYVCTSDMAAAIAAAHGKRLWLVKGCAPLLKLVGTCWGVVNKVFGNLTYDQSLSQYPQNYQVCSFQESIQRTERRKPS